MSTLNSTNMNVSRPTTKVRHAPGGSSSINLSFDEVPAVAKSAFKPVFETSDEVAPEPVVEAPVAEEVAAAAAVKPAEPEVAVPPKVTVTTSNNNVTASSTDKIALVVATSSHASEALKTRTLEVLQSRGVSEVSVTSVMSVLQLPFATKQLLANNNAFTAVIVIAALTEEVWASKEIAAAVMSGIVQLSLEQTVPIVPGLVFAPTDKEAIAKGVDSALTWVTSAIALAKPETAEIATTAAVKVSVPEPVEADTAAATTTSALPEKGSVETTPSRGRHRGAGPSSIIFG